MFILSFHGGSGKSALNNLHAYNDDGSPANPDKLLAHGGGAPSLSELRAFAWRPDGLYVVNGQKDASQLLLYSGQPAASGRFTFSRVVASRQTTNGILHPFDFTFDAAGNIYLTSQDTNVVTRLNSAGTALSVARFLRGAYPTATFLAGTQVASSKGNLPLNPGEPPPPDVPLPQGLAVSFDDKDQKVAHSVRGVLWVGDCLLVADEPGNVVKVYDATGQLLGQILGDGLTAPVHLLAHGETLYISSGNDSVYTCPLKGGKAPQGIATPTPWLTKHLHAPAGMCFDDVGNFYVALRKDKKVRRFGPDGVYRGDFIKDLNDNPEFIVYRTTSGVPVQPAGPTTR